MSEFSSPRSFIVGTAQLPNITGVSVPNESEVGNSIRVKADLDAPLAPTLYTLKLSVDNKPAIAMTGSNKTYTTVLNSINAGSHSYQVVLSSNKSGDQSSSNGEFKVVDPAVRYTKIANDGSELPASAKLGAAPKEWACTKDTNTGLIWEVKTTDGGMRDWQNTYTWYNTDTSANGGNAGTQNGGVCQDNQCDTDGYVTQVNKQGLCGVNNWRIPNVDELESIKISSKSANQPLNKELFINSTYYPNTNYWYWSNLPYPNRDDGAIGVYLGGVSSGLIEKYTPGYVRLVTGN